KRSLYVLTGTWGTSYGSFAATSALNSPLTNNRPSTSPDTRMLPYTGADCSGTGSSPPCGNFTAGESYRCHSALAVCTAACATGPVTGCWLLDSLIFLTPSVMLSWLAVTLADSPPARSGVSADLTVGTKRISPDCGWNISSDLSDTSVSRKS